MKTIPQIVLCDTLTAATDPMFHARYVLESGTAPEIDYVGHCTCGWRTLDCQREFDALSEPCPVFTALKERKERL